MFAICAAVLVSVNCWAVWNEVVGKRVWKSYQRMFYSLLVGNARVELEEAKAKFESAEVQKEYKPIKNKL